MRLLCSIGIVLFTTAAGWSPRSAGTESSPPTHFDCGRNFIRTELVSDLPAGLKPHANRGAGGRQTFSIVLNVGPGLVAVPEALAAFERAARTWESFFHDPVTVVIDADLRALGPNILGSAFSTQFNTPYSTIRDAMVADGQQEEKLLASLPSLSAYDVILPEGFAFVDELRASKALLRALGFDMSFDDANPDARISFATGFLNRFDFDRTDGITGFSFDFEGIAIHEIGHVLGFISGVDSVDRQLRAECQPVFGGPNTAVRLSPLDMFRLRPGDGAIDFTGSPRIGAPGDFEPLQVFFEGFMELGLSTGAFFGDERQASHWLDDDLNGGVFIGVMDPRIPTGLRVDVTANDVRAFGLFGWDLVPDCNMNGVPDDQDIADGTSPDCNGNGVPDECDVDCNGNGTPDDCENFADCNGNNVPDECDTDCNGNGTPDDCDGFADCNCNNSPDENDTDCNGNGAPDDCEVFADCNDNAIPDECELVGNDCNGNGVPDECDLDCNANGTPDDCEQFSDCNFNGIPDECDTDCNGNGIVDDCEFTDDCNFNGIPDECEPDCDGNGIPDDCEDFDDCDKNGLSDACDPDCNGNGTPDACEVFADCNCNGVPDECDADCNGDGTPDDCAPMDDCNGNGIPDECELDGNDCNGNGVPDDCEPDCNENGTPDDCEEFVDCNGNGIQDNCELVGNDCNANGTPDECDVAAEDCNGNGIPDDCELLTNDCNGNGVPDDCDIAEGTSPDCQPNGVPDECDLSSGNSLDLNGDGRPDECCARNADCDDGSVLTFDQCTEVGCVSVPAAYGDFAGFEGVCGPDGEVGLTDLLAVLNGFAGEFAESCDLVNIDLAGQQGSCTADGSIDLNDILAVLDAFAGMPNCQP